MAKCLNTTRNFFGPALKIPPSQSHNKPYGFCNYTSLKQHIETKKIVQGDKFEQAIIGLPPLYLQSSE